MGQQQLLLIVLGVIVVGIAIVVGIQLFNTSSVQANRDAVISDINHLASLAVEYYKKPAAMGGGGNTFTGYVLPTELDTTANGVFAISTAGNATGITFDAKGTEFATDGSLVEYTGVVNTKGVVTLTKVH